ncbi:MAG: DUF305 domain-containing protein [Beijerinckiaceae bacterium]
MKNRYGVFLAMIATSIVAMFIMTYLNTWEFGHIFWSETRAYMVLYMGAIMALIMLAYMQSMYVNKAFNIAIVASSVLVFAVTLYLVRSQAMVGDVSYMRAMIPHHSIAILTSTRAKIHDPRVRKLADGIIETQKREITEMKALISDLEGGPKISSGKSN